MAFHIDYWDYLGWPDRFAKAKFSQRQRSIASRNRSRTVYTPQLVLQGQDFRNHGRLRQSVSHINRTKARADIRLQATPQSGILAIEAQVTVTAQEARQHAVAFVALYENNLSTQVRAGENGGRTLHHDFVVRRWLGPWAADLQGLLHVQRTLRLGEDWKTRHLGVVVCVLNSRDGDVLQVVSLPLQAQEVAGSKDGRR